MDAVGGILSYITGDFLICSIIFFLHRSWFFSIFWLFLFYILSRLTLTSILSLEKGEETEWRFSPLERERNVGEVVFSSLGRARNAGECVVLH